MLKRKYAAVIFDLYGTLVDNIITEQDYRCFTETARALGVDTRTFINFWTNDDFRTQRRSGVYPSTAAEVEQVCRSLGVMATPEQVGMAVQTMRAYYGLPALTPRPGVLATLATLKHHGFALGLIMIVPGQYRTCGSNQPLPVSFMPPFSPAPPGKKAGPAPVSCRLRTTRPGPRTMPVHWRWRLAVN